MLESHFPYPVVVEAVKPLGSLTALQDAESPLALIINANDVTEIPLEDSWSKKTTD